MRRVKKKKGVKYDGKRKLRDLKVWIRKLKMEKILNDYARKESSLNNDRQEEESNPERSFEGKRRERRTTKKWEETWKVFLVLLISFLLADFLLNTEMPKKFFEQRKHKEGWIGKKNRRNVVSRRKKSKCVKEEREKECCMMEGSLCLLCCWCFVWTTPRTAVLLMIWYCSVVFDRGRRRRWTAKKKGRNKMMKILKGNIRILNVNLGNKGWDTFKSMLKNLQPDVLVATEPGDLTARPNIRGYQLIRHKSIALALKEKTVQLIDHRDNICVWRTEGTKDEKKGKEKEKTSGKKGKGKAEDEIRRSDGKKTVTFNEQAEWTDKGRKRC